MNEELALLEEARKSPQDSRPRLILADWYTDRGDSRGDLIRLQCELEKVDNADEQRRHELAWAVRKLIADHWEAWIAQPLGIESPKDATFERGLCVGLKLNCPLLLETAGVIQIQFPAIRQLCVRNLSEAELENFSCLELLERIQEIQFESPQLSLDGWIQLLNCAGLQAMDSLALIHPGWTDREFKLLCKSAMLSGLRYLALRNCRIGVRSVLALRDAAPLNRLRTLRLDDTLLGDDGAEAIATLPELARVRHLILRHNRIGVVGVRALGNFRCLRSVRELTLDGNPLRDLGARVLANAAGLSGLRRLSLRSCSLGDAGARALAGVDWTSRLDHLDLAGNEISRRVRNLLFKNHGHRVNF